MKKMSLALFIGLAFFSCDKISLESWPVMKEISSSTILTTGQVMVLDFPSESIGFAVTSEGELFRTPDGGESWQIIEVPSSNVKDVEFANPQVGYYQSSDQLFRTQDGGMTWGAIFSCDYFSLNESGNIAAGIDGMAMKEQIYVSDDQGETFAFVMDFYLDGQIIYSDYTEDLFVVGSDEEIKGVAVLAGQTEPLGEEEFGGDRVATDFFANGSKRVLVGTEGMIQYDESANGNMREVKINNLAYLAVDGNGISCLAVGEKGIVSNLDLENEYPWKEVLDVNLDAYRGPYYSVHFISNRRVIIGGDEGEILIGEL